MDYEAYFHSDILPAFGARHGGHETPRWVFVAGQPGAGKTTLIRDLVAGLGPESTQVISYDALYDRMRPDPAHPDAAALRDMIENEVCPAYVDALVDRASAMRAHVVWERPIAGNLIGMAQVARAIGYRVELQVLAQPLLESWLATLMRDSQVTPTPGQPTPRHPRRVALARMSVHYHSWPGMLAEVEDQRAVDVIEVIGRQQAVFFQNALGPDGEWQSPVFAAESLLVERQAPRSRAAVDAMLDDWQHLIARAQIAFANHENWPHASIMGLGRALEDLRDDPSLGFDPNDPEATPDPRAATAWLARLRADVTAACADPEAPAALGPRTDRLLAMVTELLAPHVQD